jgi:hypothetical protein
MRRHVFALAPRFLRMGCVDCLFVSRNVIFALLLNLAAYFNAFTSASQGFMYSTSRLSRIVLGGGACGLVRVPKRGESSVCNRACTGLPPWKEFAWKCREGWPCAAPCLKNFSSCPVAWKSAGGGLCTAPMDYTGICRRPFPTFDRPSCGHTSFLRPATDFGTLSATRAFAIIFESLTCWGPLIPWRQSRVGRTVFRNMVC